MRFACKRSAPLSDEAIPSVSYKQLVRGEKNIHPSVATDLWEEVFLAEAYLEKGFSLEPVYCQQLEERAKGNDAIWPIATRIHVQSSVERETKARMHLSIQQIPFSLPNSLDNLQVDFLAAGEKIVHALHVDWTKKLAQHVLDILVLDCRYLGLWFEPILDVLPESLFIRSLRQIPKARRLQEGSLGLAAYYAWRLNFDTDLFLRHATAKDKHIFELACFSSK